MAVPVDRPMAMVLLASEQLWPNIHSVAHWHKELSRVLIYATQNEEKSKIPAQRLKGLFTRSYPGISVNVLEGMGMLPQDLQAQLGRWRSEFPAHRWVLNITGGIKLLTLGMEIEVGRQDTRVIYREVRTGWFELVRPEGAGGVVARELTVPIEATDELPAVDLVGALWQIPIGAAIASIRADRLPVLDLTRHAAALQWKWREAFQTIGEEARDPGGILFEKYVAACILEMGVQSVARDVKAGSGAARDGKFQQVDVVANHGGRLVVIDCKLRSAEEESAANLGSVNDQIRNAGLTRTRLGGLDAQYVMVRPNRTYDPDQKLLATSLGIQLIDQADSPRLFSILAKLLGVDPILKSIKDIEELLLILIAEGATRVFAAEPALIAETTEVGEGKGIVRLDRFMKERGQSWVAYYVDGGTPLVLRASKPQGIAFDRFEKSAIAFLEEYAWYRHVETRRIGNQLEIKLFLVKGGVGALSAALEMWLGKEFSPP